MNNDDVISRYFAELLTKYNRSSKHRRPDPESDHRIHHSNPDSDYREHACSPRYKRRSGFKDSGTGGLAQRPRKRRHFNRSRGRTRLDDGTVSSDSSESETRKQSCSCRCLVPDKYRIPRSPSPCRCYSCNRGCERLKKRGCCERDEHYRVDYEAVADSSNGIETGGSADRCSRKRRDNIFNSRSKKRKESREAEGRTDAANITEVSYWFKCLFYSLSYCFILCSAVEICSKLIKNCFCSVNLNFQ